MVFFNLFLSFFKTGLFSFGGGYAMISMLADEAVKNNWMSYAEFFDIVSVSQITPGPIAINMATFVGFRQAGVLGAIVATMSVSLPSLIIILILTHFISKFNDSFIVRNIFYGLRPAVTGLIAGAVIQISWVQFFPNTDILNFKDALQNINYVSIILAVTFFLVMYKFKLNLIFFIVASGIIGLIVF